MAKSTMRILILEDDAYFRGILQNVCGEMGETFAVGDPKAALNLLAKHSFQLLLVDWHMNKSDLSAFYSAIENFQPNVPWVALFTVPNLAAVISAMKSGASDILWAAQESGALKEKIKGSLGKPKTPVYAHSFVSRLTESLTERAMTQKIPLFQARREFSKTFLRQILNQQKLRRTQLAGLLGVSPRTLHRHLST
jgi:DNA-binding NtrC family response regulator